MYGCTKVALTQLGETLRLEMKPFDVRVITLITSSVYTESKQRIRQIELPDNSLYQPVMSNLIYLKNSVASKDGMPVNVYTEQVVKDAMGGVNGIVWKGQAASIFSFLLSYFPTFIQVSDDYLLAKSSIACT